MNRMGISLGGQMLGSKKATRTDNRPDDVSMVGSAKSCTGLQKID